ncbi:MAG: large-conductance mechanosensitive channel protein MscL [Bacteroidota bacterium]
MGFIQEFKAFAMRGNLIDFAIGVVVGGAFGKVTGVFVDGIVMPVVGTLIGNQDFSEMKLVIQDSKKVIIDSSGNIIEKEVAEVYLRYGEFISSIIDFTLVAFAMFLVVKAMNRIRSEEVAAPANPTPPSKQEQLLEEIRDILSRK